MVDGPGTRLEIAPADHFEVQGPQAVRAERFARRLAQAWSLRELPRCRLSVLSAPRAHIGLGLGTQLGMSVAAGLSAFLGRPPSSSESLARSAGRATRSAIGAHGFFVGGLLVDRGKPDPSAVAPLACRAELPAQWRFVLLLPRSGEGLSGGAERRALAELPPMPPGVSRRLRRLALRCLVPAARRGDFEAFSRGLYHYNRLAGSCFAAHQGGPFAGPRAAQLVQLIRRLGVQGVGQSSWGPTLFAILPDDESAAHLLRRLSSQQEARDRHLLVAPPNRSGARIEC